MILNLQIRCRAWLHTQLGRFHYRRGDLPRARSHFQRVIATGIPSFYARLQLGRIHLRQNRFGRAVDELRIAREIDPRRFAREGFPGDPFLWLWIAERLPEARVHEGHPVAGSSSASRAQGSSESPEAFDESEAADELPWGDFADRAEAERFALLPPISLQNTDDIDWDELARDLTESD